ncbi:MAG: hypothetical protein ACPGSI_15635, partial [Pikeienuella sp.]
SADAGIAAWPDGTSSDENTLHTLHLARTGAVANVADKEDAKPVIDAYLAKFGTSPQRVWNAFDMYKQARFYDDALLLLMKLETETDGDGRSQVLRETARIYCLQGDRARASKAFETWSKAFPSHTRIIIKDVHDKYGFAQTDAGMKDFLQKNCVIESDMNGDRK